jgi:glycosyltransferase involved in cell wall biosynthesis
MKSLRDSGRISNVAEPATSEQGFEGPVFPPRVLFVAYRDLANPMAGGAELVVHQLAVGLTERGHDVALLCGGPVGRRPYRVERSGGTYTQYLKVPFKYLSHFRGRDLVVEFANGMPYFVPLWRRGATLCFVHHVHLEHWGVRFPPAVAAAGRAIESGLLPWVHRSNLFATISSSSADALASIGVPREQIRLLPLGTVAPDHLLPEANQPLFVACGRITRQKRLDVLLRVWEEVRPHVGGRLLIVGDGPERWHLQALAGEDVEFTGPVAEEEKHRLLCEAWLLVHTANLEGWGLVIMEAAARSTPTLGFAVPGVRDAVVPNETGLLATTERELAEQWVTLARNPELRQYLGRRARSRAMEHTVSRSVDVFAEIIDEAIVRHEQRRRH